MPKFKSKAIFYKVLLGKSQQKGDDLDYLCTVFERYYHLRPHAIARRAADNQDDDEDDRSSICSFSTTATADNLPGTGRVVDTYIYQPAGRWIERLAMRFTIATLHPARIAQYIEADDRNLYPAFDDSVQLQEAIATICSLRPNGSTVIAGMKGLVKQTQSNAINKSASALAALMRVSLVRFRSQVYVSVSRIEPIFHLETLAGSLVCSHPDKKWFLLLIKLAREILIAGRKPSTQKAFDPVLRKEVEQLGPLLESAQKLRQRLIRALKIYRLSGLDSLEDTIGESCAICAEAVSACIHWSARGDAYKHILETVYFTVIFIMQSIHKLTDFTSISANRHIYMVLQTVVYCIDAIVYRCLDACDVSRFDMDLLKANIAFRSLIVDDAEHILLPGSLEYINHTKVVHTLTLPRRHRDEVNTPIQSLIKAANCRTRQLLRSLDELEREVWECVSQINISTLQLKIDADPHWAYIDNFGDEWWIYWKSTLERARIVQVPETILTGEFRKARIIGVVHDDLDSWSYYQLQRGSRHKWGQYLRSNMDWDWDLAMCMKRLFKVRKPEQGGPSRIAPVSSTAIDVAAGPGGTLKISMGEAQDEDLPKAVQVAYTTKTGETRCMSFVPEGAGPRYHFDSETAYAGVEPSAEQVLDPRDAQQVSGHRKESFGGEQVVENPRTGAFPSDVSQPDACEDTAVEESINGCEWKELVCDAGCDEAGTGEDSISICSLD